jgi:hypothetical protein
VVLAIATLALVFGWSYHRSGDSFRAIRYAIYVVAFLMGLFRLHQLRNEKKSSGLSEGEFLLRQAGGATALLSQAVTTKAIGWFCVVAPAILAIFIFLATKSLQPTAIAALLLAVVCVPCAIGCFRIAAKSRRAAEDAGEKL